MNRSSEAMKAIKLLHENQEWDGYGYWLPEICVREGDGSTYTAAPTLDEFIAAILAKYGAK